MYPVWTHYVDPPMGLILFQPGSMRNLLMLNQPSLCYRTIAAQNQRLMLFNGAVSRSNRTRAEAVPNCVRTVKERQAFGACLF